MAGPQDVLDRVRHVHDVGDVGVTRLVERRGYANTDRIDFGQAGEIGRRREMTRFDYRGQIRVRDISYMGLAPIHAVDPGVRDVEANYLESLAGELHPEW